MTIFKVLENPNKILIFDLKIIKSNYFKQQSGPEDNKLSSPHALAIVIAIGESIII